jgi:hypothetical protein
LGLQLGDSIGILGAACHAGDVVLFRLKLDSS